VFVMTNDPDDNSILVFPRNPNGRLIAAGSVSTGGLGNGNEGSASPSILILSHSSPAEVA
jgi:hypothetical protein